MQCSDASAAKRQLEFQMCRVSGSSGSLCLATPPFVFWESLVVGGAVNSK
jgi:hypothetical protein